MEMPAGSEIEEDVRAESSEDTSTVTSAAE
jgi:hypothetical protein